MEPATVIRKWRAVPGETPRNGIKHTRQNDPPLDVKEVGYLHTNSSHRFRAVNFRALGLPPWPNGPPRCCLETRVGYLEDSWNMLEEENPEDVIKHREYASLTFKQKFSTSAHLCRGQLLTILDYLMKSLCHVMKNLYPECLYSLIITFIIININTFFWCRRISGEIKGERNDGYPMT